MNIYIYIHLCPQRRIGENSHNNLHTRKSKREFYACCNVLQCFAVCCKVLQKERIVTTRGGGLRSSTIFKKFNETYAPS